ncbi:MAG: pilus assembly protein [Oscillospiraceae bacterium]|nr:pilus assembly protein [Oscillospiraceae bacterium]
MGTDHKKHKRAGLVLSESGDAIVEATILFPIMTMIFAALVLISVYLPAQAALQRATQYAAVAIATELSDTWLFYDTDDNSYYWEADKNNMANVYGEIFSKDINGIHEKVVAIVTETENRAISSKAGELTVKSYVNDYIIYTEIIVTASREYKQLIDLSFIGFPETITVSATATAVVQNAEEFVRSIDIATDFAEYIAKKFGLSDVGKTISSYGEKIRDIFGW